MEEEWIARTQKKSNVVTVDALPAADNTQGDLRFVLDESTWYLWENTGWIAVAYLE